MITLIFIILLTFTILAFVVFISRQPDDFVITRSEAISTSSALPFAQVNDFHKWTAWSPWEGLDPTLQRTYSDPAEGVGAIYTWDGNSKIGAGSMLITDSQPASLVRMNLDFLRPFKANNLTEFTFNSRGDHTIVTWSMAGKETFATKLFSLMFNRDKIVGKMFSDGLAKLKSVCESAPIVN